MKKHEFEPDCEDQIARLIRGIGQIMEVAPEFQLDPFPIEFELVPPMAMHALASYGIPAHFGHWTFGRSFRQMKTFYDYGRSRLYEMVVNANPSLAFLLENNSSIANLMVGAHVVAHVDFFKNNYLFEKTSRDMPQLADERASRIREYERNFGQREVERFLDMALALSSHIDPSVHYRKSAGELMSEWKSEFTSKKERPPTEFDEFWKFGSSEVTVPEKKSKMRVPLHPDKDLLGFLRDFAPDLEDYQRDLLDIVREDSFYFYPQGQTKIMNEGWAVIFHKHLMHEMAARGYLSIAESEGWWALHADISAPKKTELNPYWFGMMMWEYLSDYFNGQLTDKETNWMKENGWPVYPKWEGEKWQDSPALPQLRRIMQTNSDISFIRNYFNYIPATRMDAYLYEVFDDGKEKTAYISTTNWEEVRDGLIWQRENRQPEISVIESNFKNQGELVLEHNFAGLELELAYAERALVYVNNIWGRKIHLITRLNGEKLFFTCHEGKVERHPMPK